MSRQLFYEDPIFLSYFHNWPNLGDRLSRTLIEYLTGRGVVASDRNQAELMAVGSLLREDIMFSDSPVEIPENDKELHIWGSGFWNPQITEGRSYYPRRRMKFHALRGRLSLEILQRIGCVDDDFVCALGDPGILFPDLVDLSHIQKNSYSVALVPHMLDQAEFNALYHSFLSAGIDVRYINITQNHSLEVIREMAGAGLVLSSSLHGVILADALHIPNRRIKSDNYESDKRHINSISDFKFADYYSAFGLGAPSSIRVGTLLRCPQKVFELVGSDDLVPMSLINAQKQALLDAFPQNCFYPTSLKTSAKPDQAPTVSIIVICGKEDEYYLHSCILSAVRFGNSSFRTEIICLESDGPSLIANQLQKRFPNMNCIQVDSHLSVREKLQIAAKHISGRHILVVEASDMIDLEILSTLCPEDADLCLGLKGWISDEGNKASVEQIEHSCTLKDYIGSDDFFGMLFSADLFHVLLFDSAKSLRTLLTDSTEPLRTLLTDSTESLHALLNSTESLHTLLTDSFRRNTKINFTQKCFVYQRDSVHPDCRPLSKPAANVQSVSDKKDTPMEKTQNDCIKENIMKTLLNKLIWPSKNMMQKRLDSTEKQLKSMEKRLSENTRLIMELSETIEDTRKQLVDTLVDVEPQNTTRKGRLIAMNIYKKGYISYIQSIQSMLEERYNVISYDLIKKKLISLDHVAILYLNWIENTLSDDDRKLFEEAKKLGIKIIWVFHNKLPHDCHDVEAELEKVRYLINIADVILVLTLESKTLLGQYVSDIDESKIKLLPHPNYVGQYGDLTCPRLDFKTEPKLFTFAFVGAIRPYKNIELLIEAFNRFEHKDRCRLLISGKIANQEYADSLSGLNKNENIYLIPENIPASMMEGYIRASDVVILPYDKQSSMNSGAMMLAFSCARTVIIPKIEMTRDFESSQMFCYDYSSREEHLEQLTRMLDKAYQEGRASVLDKGNQLYQTVKEQYSIRNIKKMLYKIIEQCMPCGDLPNYIANDLQLIKEQYMWRETARLNECMIRLAQSQLSVPALLKYNKIMNVAIYGNNTNAVKLYQELQENGIAVDFVVSNDVSSDAFEVPIYSPSAKLPPAKYVLVTNADANLYSIMQQFNTEHTDTRVISLKELY